MTMNDRPLYASRRSWRSLGKEYRVYPDRIELDTWFGRKVIPVDDILEIEIRPPFVGADVFRGKGLAYGWALNTRSGGSVSPRRHTSAEGDDEAPAVHAG